MMFFLSMLLLIAVAVALLVAGPALSTDGIGRKPRILLSFIVFLLLILAPMMLYILLGIPQLALL
ncbi:MAG: hypothetical protein ACK5WQ_01290 [Alphaproteobacteria bacterium]|jgi:hypothetical protein